MPASEFVPIDPTLDDQGAFLALSFMPHPARMKPVPLGQGESAFSGFRVMQNSLGASLAARLGVASIFSGSLEADSVAFLYEAMLYTEKFASREVGQEIIGTRWGAGLRLALRVSGLKTAASLGLGIVAANVQIGLARATYELIGIGLSQPGILSALPDPGDFDFNSYHKVLEATKAVKEYMANNLGQLVAKPFAVSLSKPFEQQNLENSQSVVFAMLRLFRKKTLKEALAEISGRAISPDVVKETYGSFGNICDETIRPDGSLSSRAQKWLNP